MNTKFGYAALSVAITLAAGCASSTTDEVETTEVVEPVVETVAEPVEIETEETTVDEDALRAAEALAAANQGPAKGSIEDFVVSAGDKVYFDVDRYNLDESDRTVLRAQAEWLMAYPDTTVLVAGNCDERGTREYNVALGERRAAAAADYLVSLGVPASRIETISYGKSRPTDPRSTPEAWAVNRNAHTQIVGGAIN